MKSYFALLVLLYMTIIVQGVKVRTRCKCNFVVDGMPTNSNRTLDNIFPSKYRRAKCDEYALDKCRRRCIRKENQLINGDLDQLYPNVNVPHAEIICYWLENDVDRKPIRVEAMLECARHAPLISDTGIVYSKPLSCKNGHYVPNKSL